MVKWSDEGVNENGAMGVFLHLIRTYNIVYEVFIQLVACLNKNNKEIQVKTHGKQTNDPVPSTATSSFS